MKAHHTVVGGLIRPVSEAPAHHKQMLRLLRRARERHVFPERVEHGLLQATIIFCANIMVMNSAPSRIVRIRDDGSMVPEILPVETRHGMRADSHGLEAFDQRMDWLDLNWAAECRRFGWKYAAQVTIRMPQARRS